MYYELFKDLSKKLVRSEKAMRRFLQHKQAKNGIYLLEIEV